MGKLLIGIATLAALAVLAAVLLVNAAHRAAFFAPRITFSQHLPAPADPMQTFDVLGYLPAEVRAGQRPVPRKFFASLPQGLEEVDPAVRKRLFIATTLPLILRVNELIAQDRERLTALMKKHQAGRRLTALERRWLARLAERYGLAAAEGSEAVDFEALLRRVDTIPASLALAQAAIESGWGTSRFATIGQALYGQWTWRETEKGIVPLRRTPGKTHRVRSFDYLIESVRGYMTNLNRSPAYAQMRRLRADLRAQGLPVTGRALAPGLVRYSERREDYVRDVRGVIAANRLGEFDDADLAPRR